MRLTQSFRDEVQARLERDSAFRIALLKEMFAAHLHGNTAPVNILLRDLVSPIIGPRNQG